MGALTDRMSARVGDEDLLEVRTANGEDDLVALQQLPVAGDGAVDEVAAVEKALKARREVLGEL